MKNAYFFKYVILFLSLGLASLWFILNFDVEIIAYFRIVLALVHVDNFFGLYFWDTYVLVAFLPSKSIKMNANDYH